MQQGSRGVVGGTVPTGTERKGLFFSVFEGIVRRAERTVGDCDHMNTGCSFISWQARKQRVMHFSTQVAFSIFSFCLGHSPLDSATIIKGRCSSSVNHVYKVPMNILGVYFANILGIS